MSLTKWFRRNNRKVLAIVVVVIMIGFIGGSALRLGCRATGFGPGQVIAYYGQDGEITRNDILEAERELNILRQLGVPYMLKSQDVRGVFFGELLFAESKSSPQVIGTLRRAIRAQQLRISDKQILDIYQRTQSEEIYWILLKKEARQAGIALGRDIPEVMLRRMIQNMFEGVSYAQVVNRIIDSGASEEKILSTFANLLEIHEYSRIVSMSEDVTLAQISKLSSFENEKLDAEFVGIPSEIFVDIQPEPTQEQVKEHFEKYKSYYQGQVTEENPCGFGYKNNQSLKLEYIIVKRKDIEKLIAEPTQEEKEKYYQNNRYLPEFMERVSINPNDPNSPTTLKLMSFGRVTTKITNLIRAERIEAKTEDIINNAKYLSEHNYGDIDPAELSSEKLKELAADFRQIAEQISDTYSVETYAGETGLLDFQDIQTDEYLSRLYYQPAGSEQISYPLAQLVFTAEGLDSEDVMISSANKPRLYETIGPVNDSKDDIAALIRVIEVFPETIPSALEESISKETVKISSDPHAKDKVYLVKDKVIEDLKKLSAMETASVKTGEFTALVQSQGWQQAVDNFNELYPAQPNEPNNFEIRKLTGVQRLSKDSIESLAERVKGFAGSRLTVDRAVVESIVIDKLFSLVPADSNSPKDLPLTVAFKPYLSYYCIKSMNLNHIDLDQYYQSKSELVYNRGVLEFQNLAAVHFKPGNILKRMNFRVVKKNEKSPALNESDEKSEPNQGQS